MTKPHKRNAKTKMLPRGTVSIYLSPVSILNCHPPTSFMKLYIQTSARGSMMCVAFRVLRPKHPDNPFLKKAWKVFHWKISSKDPAVKKIPATSMIYIPLPTSSKSFPERPALWKIQLSISTTIGSSLALAWFALLNWLRKQDCVYVV